MRNSLIAMTLAAGLAGCMPAGPPLRADELGKPALAAMTEEQRAAMDGVPAVEGVFGEMLVMEKLPDGMVRYGVKKPLIGTNTPVAPDLFLASGHQFKGATTGTLIIDGGCYVVDIETEYAGDAFENDCAVLRLRGAVNPPPPSIRIDRSRPEIGREVYAIGYWQGQPTGNVPPDTRGGILSWMRGHVTEPPSGESDEVIYVTAADFDFFIRVHGMSGGPAVAWDEATGEWILFGLTVGVVWIDGDWWIVIHPLPDF